VTRESRGGSVRVPNATALSVDRADVVAEAQPEAAAQRGTTLGRPPNDHDLSIALGEHIVVANGHGACNAQSPLSNVVVGISEPRLLRNSVWARAQYRKPA